MRAEFREKIRHMSMEELQQMKQDIGTKAMDKMMGIGKKSSAAGEQLRKSKADFKRENKNRPRETSSKKTVGRFKDVVGLTSEQKSAKRDPRFDSLCGKSYLNLTKYKNKQPSSRLDFRGIRRQSFQRLLQVCRRYQGSRVERAQGPAEE